MPGQSWPLSTELAKCAPIRPQFNRSPPSFGRFRAKRGGSWPISIEFSIGLALVKFGRIPVPNCPNWTPLRPYAAEIALFPSHVLPTSVEHAPNLVICSWISAKLGLDSAWLRKAGYIPNICTALVPERSLTNVAYAEHKADAPVPIIAPN